MTTETRIEAAERLRAILRSVPNPGIAQAIFTAALATERRATVERLREQLHPEFFDSISGKTVTNVLDEELAR